MVVSAYWFFIQQLATLSQKKVHAKFLTYTLIPVDRCSICSQVVAKIWYIHIYILKTISCVRVFVAVLCNARQGYCWTSVGLLYGEAISCCLKRMCEFWEGEIFVAAQGTLYDRFGVPGPLRHVGPRWLGLARLIPILKRSHPCGLPASSVLCDLLRSVCKIFIFLFFGSFPPPTTPCSLSSILISECVCYCEKEEREKKVTVCLRVMLKFWREAPSVCAVKYLRWTTLLQVA